MYRDTDSLFYKIETDDIYQDLKQLTHTIDLTHYPKDRHLHKEPKKSDCKIIGWTECWHCYKSRFFETKDRLCKTLQTFRRIAKGVSKYVRETLHHGKFKQVLESTKHMRKVYKSYRQKWQTSQKPTKISEHFRWQILISEAILLLILGSGKLIILSPVMGK